MVDSVTKNVLLDGEKRYEVLLTNVSDGTGESAVRKIILEDLSPVPESLALVSIHSVVNGFDSISVLWDRSTQPKIIVLPPGQTDIQFERAVLDPYHGQQGTTGDILLTTNGSATSQDSYIIRLKFKKKGKG